jgi:zinc transport system substrate-binding protein
MIHTHRTAVWPIFIVLCLLLAPAFAEAAPRVVASIKPVHALVAGVMNGAGTPRLLIKGGATPHMHALRPSQARLLQQAEVVFWVGPELESFLVKPLARGRTGRRVVALSAASGIQLRAAGGVEANSDHRDAAHKDMHIWLDPANARAMVDAIAAVLATADPPGAARYRANAQGLHARLAALDASLGKKLAAVRHVPFIAYHDAYGYFIARYGLKAVGAITASPEHRPGVARLRRLRRAIVSHGVRCVFTEPEFEPAIVRALVRGTPARIAVLDPLGAGIPPGKDAYFSLMQALAGSLTACLVPEKG